MTTNQVKERIICEKPQIVVLCGKTCTGKSTFARELESLNYKHIEFDLIVRESVRNKFGAKDKEAFTVYGGIAPKEWQESFETTAKGFIDNMLAVSNIALDSAIADPTVLQRILGKHADEICLVYFHPFDRGFYYQSISKRFSDDVINKKVSFPIWDHITEVQLSDYKVNGIKGNEISKKIKQYADESIEKSKERLELFKTAFPSIIITGH